MPKRLIITLASASLALAGVAISLSVPSADAAGPAALRADLVASGSRMFAPPVTSLQTSGGAHAAISSRATTATDNWGGYVASGGNGSFSQAQATFTVPTIVACAPAENSSSVFWVGLDGWNTSTVEQAGVAADCNGGVPQYYAWWEDVPLNSGIFTTVSVSSGDLIRASVVHQGGGHYQLQVVDATSNTSGTTTAWEPGATDSSGECIAEDPSGDSALLPYTDFGTVSFAGCTANGVAIGALSPISTDTINGQGTVVASTSPLSNATSFTVTRVDQAPAVVTSSGQLAQPIVGMASTSSGDGYWLADAYGGVAAEGGATSYGSMAGHPLNSPIVHIVGTSDGKGYWLVAADGGTFAFGDAAFYGSMGGVRLNAPVVDLAPSPDGKGYWLVASDGGVFAFGSAAFSGSMGGVPLNRPVVGISTDQQTGGYWEVATDGGVFAFNAPFYGSTGSLLLNAPILSMTPEPGGHGYLMAASDGGAFAFGDAAFHGSMGGQSLIAPIVDIDSDPSTGGYWMVNSDGSVYSFGAPFYGSA